MGPIVTLTTDFGLTGTYVAAMKAVLLGVNPSANLVDIRHTIRPQDVLHAAFTIDTVYDLFPGSVVHVVVVDPGVGTARRPTNLKTPEADVLAPDNGALRHIV